MPPPAAPSNFGSSRARSTPPPTVSPPRNSAAAYSLSSQPMPPRIRPPQIPFPRGFKLQTQLNHGRWEEFLKSCNKKWPHSRPFALSTQNLCDPLFPNFYFLLSISFPSVHRMLARFPFLAQPAHGFAQPHRQRGNRFKAVFASMRERAVILAVNFGEQQLRVSQNSRQRIIEFVAQHLSKIFRGILEGFVGAVRHSLRLAQAAANQAQRRRQASSIAHQIVCGARIDQRREFRPPRRRSNHHHRGIDRQRSHHRVEPRQDRLQFISFRHHHRLFQQNRHRRLLLQDSPRRGQVAHGSHANSRDARFELPPRRGAQRRIVAHDQDGLFPIAHGPIRFSPHFFLLLLPVTSGGA